MRRIFQLSLLCLAGGVGNGCKPQTLILTEDIPTAGIRFINAVPDTGSMDFRPVDIVENSNFYSVAFRGTSILLYKNARAGSRHFKIFRTPTLTDPSSTQIAVASTVVKDTTVTLEASKRYTFILWGLSRTGSSPAMQLTMLTDDPADPGTQVALRVLNACVPALCGTSANGVVDARAFTTAQGIGGATVVWTNVQPLTATTYQNAATNSAYTFDIRPAGGVTTGSALVAATAPAGTAQTVDLVAIPGTNIAGSAVTGILVPRSLAGSQAPSTITTPGIIFVWDRRPPQTCALCAPAQ